MKNSIHNSAASLLRSDYPEVSASGYHRAINSLMVLRWRRDSPCYSSLTQYAPSAEADCNEIDLALVRDEYHFRYLPDGYFPDFNTQTLLAFEVEDTNRISPEKLNLYWETYYTVLNPIGWGLGLVSVDRWGHRRAIPYFDYVFADMIGLFPPGSPMAIYQALCGAEFKVTESLIAPRSNRSTSELISSTEPIREPDISIFWRNPETAVAFKQVLGIKRSPRSA